MARLLLMTDFSESYANKLLKGIVRFSHDHDPWAVCKMPLSLRDSGRMDEVVKFALSWQADAIIGQFLPTDDVDSFSRHGIIAIAQDYHQKFPNISNISGDYAASGRICADYLIKKRVHNFGYFGLKGMVWSDERRDSFVEEVRQRVPDSTISILEKDDISATLLLGRVLFNTVDDIRHVIEHCQQQCLHQFCAIVVAIVSHLLANRLIVVAVGLYLLNSEVYHWVVHREQQE